MSAIGQLPHIRPGWRCGVAPARPAHLRLWRTRCRRQQRSRVLGHPGRYTQAAAGTNDNGTIELFTLDQAGSIRHARQTGPDAFGSFGGWEVLPGALTSIAVAGNRFGILHVFGTNAADQIFHLNQLGQNADNWTNWVQLNGALRNVTAFADNTSTMNLLGVNAEGNIFWNRDQLYSGGWTHLPGQLGP